jgi:hypothetical protein
MDKLCLDNSAFYLLVFVNVIFIMGCLYMTWANIKMEPSGTISSYIDDKLNQPVLLPPQPLANINTRGAPILEVVGYLSSTSDSNKMMKLVQKNLHGGRYEYYTNHHVDYSLILPVNNPKYEQLADGDLVTVQSYTDKFIVNLY